MLVRNVTPVIEIKNAVVVVNCLVVEVEVENRRSVIGKGLVIIILYAPVPDHWLSFYHWIHLVKLGLLEADLRPILS